MLVFPVLSPSDKVIIHSFGKLPATVKCYDSERAYRNGLKRAFVMCMSHFSLPPLFFQPDIISGKPVKLIVSQKPGE